MTVLDLEPPARQIITLAGAVTDEMLPAPTPCGDYTVADLLAHMMGLTIAFRDAGAKAGSPAQDAAPGRAALEDGWREQLPGRLLAMAEAWHAPQAWEGLTTVGGQGKLKGQVIRLGHMGYTDELDVISSLAALEMVLSDLGLDIEPGAAVTAAQQVLLARTVAGSR